MSWLKLSDDYSVMLDELSDAAYRTHTEALNLVMKRERGPVLRKPMLHKQLSSPRATEAIAELVAQGFWEDLGSAYRVIFHMEHQPEPDVMAARKTRAADRQRKHRRKSAGITGIDPVTRDEMRDEMRDETRDPGRDGSGRDGQIQQLREDVAEADWPVYQEDRWRSD